jgi:hypothetical protein
LFSDIRDVLLERILQNLHTGFRMDRTTNVEAHVFLALLVFAACMSFADGASATETKKAAGPLERLGYAMLTTAPTNKHEARALASALVEQIGVDQFIDTFAQYKLAEQTAHEAFAKEKKNGLREIGRGDSRLVSVGQIHVFFRRLPGWARGPGDFEVTVSGKGPLGKWEHSFSGHRNNRWLHHLQTTVQTRSRETDLTITVPKEHRFTDLADARWDFASTIGFYVKSVGKKPPPLPLVEVETDDSRLNVRYAFHRKGKQRKLTLKAHPMGIVRWWRNSTFARQIDSAREKIRTMQRQARIRTMRRQARTRVRTAAY